MEWIKREHAKLSESLKYHFSDSIILAQALADHRLENESGFLPFLDPDQYRQTSPFSFAEMDKSIDRVLTAIKSQQMIGIWGDFDVDGQTSTAILLDSLRLLGARTCFHIPIRATESHGVDRAGFSSFIARYQPELVLTCDTGISDISSINYANSLGIDVIITDHHKMPDALPDTFAIINPHQLPEDHPLSYLAGVGVAFQVVRALSSYFPDILDASSYYDLVALGTVADLAEMRHENRFYTQMGLRQMAQNLRPALKALLTVSSSKVRVITETTIGFTLAPRLNAAGRLGDANPNVEFLISSNENLCLQTANHLEQLNAERKLAVDNVLYSAHEMIKRSPDVVQKSAIVMMNPHWEGGVLGIAAGQLAEEYHRPVILLREEGGSIIGSARSIQGIDITAAIAEQSHLLDSYGGHAMAGGLRLPADNLPVFSIRLIASLQKFADSQEQVQLEIDHFIPFSDISSKLADELKYLSPFGPGNPKPLFASQNLSILSARKFGVQDQHIKWLVRDINGDESEIIAWNQTYAPPPTDPVTIAFHILPDESTQQSALHLEFIAMRPAEDQDTVKADLIESAIAVVDLRSVPDPLQQCVKMMKEDIDLQWWYEGQQKPAGVGPLRSRIELVPASGLAILTAPPDFRVMQDLIATARPSRLYLLCLPQAPIDTKTLLLEIGKAIKECLSSETCMLSLQDIAARTNQSTETIRLGLLWYQAHGDICIVSNQANFASIQKGTSEDQSELLVLQKKLNKSLKETAAFKEYYKSVEPEFLLRPRNHTD